MREKGTGRDLTSAIPGRSALSCFNRGKGNKPGGPYNRPGIGIRTLQAVLFLISLVVPCMAGDRPVDPDLAIENLHELGPIHFDTFFGLRELGYDDNIRLDSRNREGDITATLTPGLRAVILMGDRGGFHLRQKVDYVAFQQNSDLNHWNSSTRVKGIVYLKDFLVSLEDGYTSERERPNFEIDQRIREKRNEVLGKFQTNWTRRLGGRLTVGNTKIQYSSDDERTREVPLRLNRSEDSFGLLTEYQILPRTTVTIEGIWERADFDDDSEGRDTDSYSFLSGFRFDPSAFFEGILRIGVLSLDAPDRPGSDFDGTVGDANLTTKLGRRSRVRATFERSLGFSTLKSNLYFLSRYWSVGYEHFLSSRIRVEAVYRQGRNRYPEEVIRLGSNPFRGIRIDRLSTMELGARYRAGDQFSFQWKVFRQERDSNDSFLDETRYFYSFGTIYHF